MKTRTKFLKRFTSMLLVLSMMIATLPTLISGAVTTAGNAYKRETDAVTLNDWKNYFGTDVLDTINAGRIWNDKSVFTDPSVLGTLVDASGNSISVSADDRNFFVTLSSIAANKSIVGYSHIPTDTILVLDISGSMGPGRGNNDAVADMVTAANAAITSLQGLNNHNRIGVVLYSANSNDDSPAILLPLDRYTTTNIETYNNGTPNDTSDDKTISVYLKTNSQRSNVSIASDVKDGDGNDVTTRTVSVTGGTYIQSGIDTAMDMFLAVPESDTVISGSDFQNGTERKPVIVLMSDGEATFANTNYTNVPSGSNVGNGSDPSNNVTFLTQLTAAQAKARIAEHYNDVEPLFYTLGLGGSSAVLDPDTTSNTVKNLWSSFVSLDQDEFLTISRRAVQPTEYITSVDDMYYVTDYFEATEKADLYTTFEAIVNQIIIQSLYSPTDVSTTTDFDGFITFTDVLGEYMEVKEIEGILLGNTLFTGELLAKAVMGEEDTLGTITDPTELGNDLIWAIIQRMGLNKHPDYPTYEDQRAEARSLLNLAYTHHQISYNSQTGEFTNFIGWYADANGQYIGFWDPEHTDDMIPENAVYTNKCYGMLGEVKDGYRESNMLYITIQIHTNIETKEQTVVFNVPSSLIPVVSYHVTIEGTSLDDAGDISVEIDTAEPIRLLYEVGLRSDINTLNITSKVSDTYKNADGTYSFYTNAYDNKIITDAEANEDENSHIGEPGINTFGHFNPSKENERYYYSVDTPIYVLSGGTYVPYDGTTAPGSVDLSTTPLYREYTHFKYDTANGEWHLYTEHAAIHHATLVDAKRYDSGNDAGEWYIPAGTIHHNLDAREVLKADGSDAGSDPDSVNEVRYVDFPFIHAFAKEDYHIDIILGNNGKLTVTPSTALAISKAIDETITDLNAAYTFTVSGGSANAAYTKVTEDANGNTVTDTSNYAFDADGKTTVSVKAGETVYLVGISAGSYSVTEQVGDEDNYHVKSISVNGSAKSGENVSTVSSVTVEDQKVTSVEFVNTLGVGTTEMSYLVISKTVTHDFGDDYTVSTTKTFPISIDLGTAYANATVSISTTKQTDAISKTANANGVVTYDIAHGEHITIEVAVGTTITVTETLGSSYPGFKTPVITYTNGNLTGAEAQTIVADSNLVVSIVNDYEAEKVSPVNMTVNTSKVLEGREWLDTDVFTFQLQRYNPHDASYEVIGELEATKGDTELDFSSIIQAYTFTSIGQYHFRVIEIIDGEKIGGVSYDLEGRYFNVIVTDNLSGKLIISDVEAIALASVTLENGVYKIVADDVKNTYAPAGDDEVFINISKSVVIKDAPSGVTGNFNLSGFEFGLYDEDGELVVNDPFVTDTSGSAVIKLMFPASVLNGNTSVSFYYTVKEIVPEGDTTYDYDTSEYKIKVDVIDNLDGTVSTALSVYDEEESAYVEESSNESTAEFVNEYVIDDTVSKTLNIKKIVENLGTKKLTPKDFKFILKDSDGNEIDTYTSDENGDAKFTLEYGVSDIGKTYVYTLTEVDTKIDNVVYSEEEYTISAKIKLTASNELSLEVKVVDSEDDDVTGALEFTNTYDEDIPPAGSDGVTITIDKSVSIKNAPTGVTGNLSPEGFEFILTDDKGNEVGTYTVNANGEATITLNFTAEDDVNKTYYYILKEVIPNDSLYDYDETEYKFKVEVVDNRDGTISAKLSVYDATAQSYTATDNDTYTAEFENKFIISGNTTLDFTIVKNIESTYGFPLSPEGFVFILRDASSKAEIGRFTTNAEGKATFSYAADLSLVGQSVTVTLEELDDGRENVVYSTQKYTITVKVELNENNEVVIVPTITDVDGQPVSGTTLEFTNVYNYNETPDTGDNTLLVGAGLALLAIIGGAVFFTRKRRLA